jgi:hypothetical protein
MVSDAGLTVCVMLTETHCIIRFRSVTLETETYEKVTKEGFLHRAVIRFASHHDIPMLNFQQPPSARYPYS